MSEPVIKARIVSEGIRLVFDSKTRINWRGQDFVMEKGCAFTFVLHDVWIDSMSFTPDKD